MQKNKKILSAEEIRETFESMGYFANEEIIYDTFNGLCLFLEEEESPGQDIYAICLDGPPGAGKTEFANAYTKLLSKIYDNVEMVSYQCDATTGKTELFEDINVIGAVTRDESKINIPGYLVKAIQLVNKGKRVILFIDEYDKAREETDSFFYQLLQSGKINTNQHGDLEISENLRDNLQVIFCRNDFRERLSGPLTRRLRMLSLDYLKPEVFYKIATDKLINRAKKPVNDELLNLVSLMYQVAYEKKDVFSRLPSASEMMIAISDANRLMTLADAPKHIIYKTLVKNMFKDPSDLLTFEGLVNSGNQKATETAKSLAPLLEEMKTVQEEEKEFNLREELSSKVFQKDYEGLIERIQKFEQLIKDYEEKFKELEIGRKKAIDDEINKIRLENGVLVARTEIPNTIKVFEDETAYIKRGMSVFKQVEGDPTEVATMMFNNLAHHEFYEFLINHAAELDIQIYEDGVILSNVEGVKLLLVNDYDENDSIRYRFLSSEPIIPTTFIMEIEKLVNAALKIYKSLTSHTVGSIINEASGMSVAQLFLNALIFDNKRCLYNDAKEAEENVYNLVGTKFISADSHNITIVDHSSLENPDLVAYSEKIKEFKSKKELKK